jgi:hypothetical protein
MIKIKMFFVCVTMLLSGGSFTQARAETPEELLAPWNEMNQKFRSGYSEARAAVLAGEGPLVIQREDRLILHYNKKREEINIIPAKYSMLKSVAHIPLTIFVLLKNSTSAPISDSTISKLQEFRTSFIKASENLAKWNLSEDCLQRQKLIVDRSAALIDDASKVRSISESALLSFCREMGPLVLKNAYEAISAELELVDSQMKKWQTEIPEQEWKRLRVAIMSGHMPREQNSLILYFQKYFGESREGESIIYGEGKNEEAYAEELVATHILDKGIAVFFFKDPWRMHRDLLSDGAKQYLKKHSPTKLKR